MFIEDYEYLQVFTNLTKGIIEVGAVWRLRGRTVGGGGRRPRAHRPPPLRRARDPRPLSARRGEAERPGVRQQEVDGVGQHAADGAGFRGSVVREGRLVGEQRGILAGASCSMGAGGSTRRRRGGSGSEE